MSTRNNWREIGLAIWPGVFFLLVAIIRNTTHIADRQPLLAVILIWAIILITLAGMFATRRQITLWTLPALGMLLSVGLLAFGAVISVFPQVI